jgi:hypothetical protein
LTLGDGMHCKTCDYPLWNLRARECPECGGPFKPSEFEFVLNSVRFCCPRCSQAYYGTGAHGHLVPDAFACVNCGQPLHMDEMVLLPAEGVGEEQTKAQVMPWLNRGRGGWIRAWFGTVGMAMVRPVSMMRAVPLEASLFRAWWFCVVTQLLVSIVWTVPMLMLFLFIGIIAAGSASGGPGGGPGQMLGPMLGVFGFTLGSVVFFVIAAMIWGLITHGILRLGGPTRATIGRTYQAICYSSGANILTGTPCVGQYFGWIWWVVSAVLAVKEAQQVSGGRAALAVLLAPVMLLLSVIALYAFFVYMALSAGAPGSATWVSSTGSIAPTWEVQPIEDGLQAFENETGMWPDHATRLILEENNEVSSAEFVLLGSNTNGESVPVASGNLYDFDFADEEALERLVTAAAAALPADVVAHRVGDFVFTYHGIDPAGSEDLWLFVAWPDPDQGGGPLPTQIVSAGTLGGNVVELSVANFASHLAEQNLLRATEGLPPLPWPAQVTNQAPAPATVAEPDGAEP